MTKIDQKKVFLILSVAAIVALMSTVTFTAFASNNNEENTGILNLCREGRRWDRRLGLRGGRLGCVEVSEEYEANAIAIAESDVDVQELLAEGYSVVGVRPIIKSSVDADGDVTTTATSAIVLLENENTTSHAAVMVDIEDGSVTQIVILTRTRTVIDKT